ISVARRARAATLRNSRRRPADSSRLVIYVGVRLAGNLVHTSDDDLQRLVKLPSIASGGDLPGGRRGSVNDQARLAMGAGAVCCRLLSGRPLAVVRKSARMVRQDPTTRLEAARHARSRYLSRRGSDFGGVCYTPVGPGVQSPEPRTQSPESRAQSLSAPVIQAVLPEHVASSARVNIRLACCLIGGGDGPPDAGRLAAQLVEVGNAARRHSALHRARIPQRKPRSIERAGN